jgi:hypothetical protein
VTFFSQWMDRWRRRNVAAIGYRFGDAPTSEEMAAAYAAELGGAPPAELAFAQVTPLSAAQTQRLLKLVEECGEVAHGALKILARGYDDCVRGGRGPTRRTLLEREVADLSAAVSALYRPGELQLREVRFWERRKTASTTGSVERTRGQ